MMQAGSVGASAGTGAGGWWLVAGGWWLVLVLVDEVSGRAMGTCWHATRSRVRVHLQVVTREPNGDVRLWETTKGTCYTLPGMLAQCQHLVNSTKPHRSC